jgi:hypothetical protein
MRRGAGLTSGRGLGVSGTRAAGRPQQACTTHQCTGAERTSPADAMVEAMLQECASAGVACDTVGMPVMAAAPAERRGGRLGSEADAAAAAVLAAAQGCGPGCACGGCG